MESKQKPELTEVVFKNPIQSMQLNESNAKEIIDWLKTFKIDSDLSEDGIHIFNRRKITRDGVTYRPDCYYQKVFISYWVVLMPFTSIYVQECNVFSNEEFNQLFENSQKKNTN